MINIFRGCLKKILFSNRNPILYYHVTRSFAKSTNLHFLKSERTESKLNKKKRRLSLFWDKKKLGTHLSNDGCFCCLPSFSYLFDQSGHLKGRLDRVGGKEHRISSFEEKTEPHTSLYILAIKCVFEVLIRNKYSSVLKH